MINKNNAVILGLLFCSGGFLSAEQQTVDNEMPHKVPNDFSDPTPLVFDALRKGRGSLGVSKVLEKASPTPLVFGALREGTSSLNFPKVLEEDGGEVETQFSSEDKYTCSKELSGQNSPMEEKRKSRIVQRRRGDTIEVDTSIQLHQKAVIDSESFLEAMAAESMTAAERQELSKMQEKAGLTLVSKYRDCFGSCKHMTKAFFDKKSGTIETQVSVICKNVSRLQAHKELLSRSWGRWLNKDDLKAVHDTVTCNDSATSEERITG